MFFCLSVWAVDVGGGVGGPGGGSGAGGGVFVCVRVRVRVRVRVCVCVRVCVYPVVEHISVVARLFHISKVFGTCKHVYNTIWASKAGLFTPAFFTVSNVDLILKS